MLLGSSAVALGGRQVETRLAASVDFRLHVIRRSDVVFDSRFLVGFASPSPRPVIYAVRSGWLQLPGEERREGPLAWVLAPDEFEAATPPAAAAGTRATFCSGGSPAVIAELSVAPHLLTLPAGLRLPAHALPREVAEIVDAVFAADSSNEQRARMNQLLDAFVEAGWLDRSILASAGETLRPNVERLWKVFHRFYEAQQTGVTLDEISAFTALSARQTHRDAMDVLGLLGLPPSLRASVRVLRLRRAVLLLGDPSIPVLEIARRVGYGGRDALERAFRDAALPPPHVVRRELEAAMA